MNCLIYILISVIFFSAILAETENSVRKLILFNKNVEADLRTSQIKEFNHSFHTIKQRELKQKIETIKQKVIRDRKLHRVSWPIFKDFYSRF